MSVLTCSDLKNFVFDKVIGGHSERKTLFFVMKHITENQKGILICDKNPFIEEPSHISKWMANADLKLLTSNDIYGSYQILIPKEFNGIKASLIYPASEEHIIRYSRQEFYLIYESAVDYETLTLPYIKEKKISLNWVYNFLDKKSEAERIVLEDMNEKTGFLLAPDLKWNGKDVECLYLLAIIKRRDIQSVRDLTLENIPLLENILNKCSKYVNDKYGLKKSQLLMYFHYQPTFYHLHVHIINAKYEAPGLKPTSILLQTAIENIKQYPDFYTKATLPFFCKEKHPLYSIYNNAGRI